VDPSRGDAGGATTIDPEGMTVYRIVVQGELSDRFAGSFEGLRLETGDGETALVGDIVDQAQLQGVLSRLADLGLALLRVNQVQSPARSNQDIATGRGLP
jgi:hypothetical protein